MTKEELEEVRQRLRASKEALARTTDRPLRKALKAAFYRDFDRLAEEMGALDAPKVGGL